MGFKNMGQSVNQKAGLNLSGDRRKDIVIMNGFFKNLAEIPWIALSAADQYEIDKAYDGLTDEQVKTSWGEIISEPKPEKSVEPVEPVSPAEDKPEGEISGERDNEAGAKASL